MAAGCSRSTSPTRSREPITATTNADRLPTRTRAPARQEACLVLRPGYATHALYEISDLAVFCELDGTVGMTRQSEGAAGQTPHRVTGYGRRHAGHRLARDRAGARVVSQAAHT